MHQQTQKIDFRAIMMQPYVFTGVKTVKIMTPEKRQDMVRANHPANHCRAKATVKNFQ